MAKSRVRLHRYPPGYQEERCHERNACRRGRRWPQRPGGGLLPGEGGQARRRARGRRQGRRRLAYGRDDPGSPVQHPRGRPQHHQHDPDPCRVGPGRRGARLPADGPVRDRVLPRRSGGALPPRPRPDGRLDRRAQPGRRRGLPSLHAPGDPAGEDGRHGVGERLHPGRCAKSRCQQGRSAAAGREARRRPAGSDARPRRALRLAARDRAAERPHPGPGRVLRQPLLRRAARRRRVVLRLLAGGLPSVRAVASPRRLAVADHRADPPSGGLGR